MRLINKKPGTGISFTGIIVLLGFTTISGLSQILRPDFNYEEYYLTGFFASDRETIINSRDKLFVNDNLPDTVLLIRSEYFKWDTILDDWQPSTRTLTVYDCSNFFGPLEETTKTYSPYYEENWENKSQNLYQYDKNGKIISYIQSRWDIFSYSWIPEFKTIYDRDPSGLFTSQYRYIWDTESEKLVLNYFNKYTFDERGRTFEFYYFRFTTSGDTSSGQKTEYYYNQQDQQYEILFYTWDNLLRNWIYDDRYFYYFDINGRRITTTSQSWDTTLDAWVYTIRYDYLYDSNNNQIQSATQKWDPSLNAWVYYSKSDYLYDNNNNQIQESYESWDTILDAWVYLTRRNYLYDSSNNQIQESYESWDTILDAWVYLTRRNYLYDSSNNRIQYTIEKWDTTLNAWVYKSKTNNIYRNIDPLQVEIENLKGKINCLIYDHDSLILSPVQGTPPYFYVWDDRLSRLDSLATGYEPDNYYSYQVTDSFCTVSDSLYIPPDPEICLVTIDLITNKNLIVWEKIPNVEIKAYNIYREYKIGQYEYIGSKDAGELSIFRDETADPESRAYLYKITISDTCGNESELKRSLYHKSSFLQYVSSIGGVNLSWTDYRIEGIDQIGDYLSSYVIYRGTDSSGLAEYMTVGSINTFTDNDPDALLRRYYYRVGCALLNPCYPTGTAGKKDEPGPYSLSMSNIEDNRIMTEGFKDIKNERLSINPNPFSEYTIMTFNNADAHPYTLYIMDLSGKVCRVINNITTSRFLLEKAGLKEGFYIIELRGPELFRGRLVVK